MEEKATEPAEEGVPEPGSEIMVKSPSPELSSLVPPRPSDYAISTALYPMAMSSSHEVEGLRGVLDGLAKSRAEEDDLESWEKVLFAAQAHLVQANRSILAALAALAPEKS